MEGEAMNSTSVYKVDEKSSFEVPIVPRSASVSEQISGKAAPLVFKRYTSQGMPSNASHVRKGEGLEIGEKGPVFSLMNTAAQDKFVNPNVKKAIKHSDHSYHSSAMKETTEFFKQLGSKRGVQGLFGSRVQHENRQQVKGSGQVNRQRRNEALVDYPKGTPWMRLLRKLGFDSKKKVHAARSEWLNYDQQSYAMNFEEKGREPLHSYHSQPLPKISGPGAREIVTVLLQRTPSANRNSGAILIPKRVNTEKPETSPPLWQRRSVQAPQALELKKKDGLRPGRRNSI